ncbi:MAG: glutamate-5-semialdehyde dehydrogenase [Clostridiales bacterium]|jgi:glutamate-5-semialdehyde dehydrogenase|nr:glutamate-5-semialdehyde dehydrogenase [Clostridiales bacterium]
MYDLETMGKEAKAMSVYVRKLSTNQKNEILFACAKKLEENAKKILPENKKDMDKTDPSRTAFNDRLLLNESRIAGMAEGIRKVARHDDPTGETLYMKTLPNGLKVGEKRVPIGVIALIYEGRPNVTTDSFALIFKAGNACVLRGSKEAINSNIALVKILQETLEQLGHPRKIIQLVEDTSRETAAKLMKMDKYIDVLIPRGGAGLIASAVQNSTIPVIATGVGNCHIYVDEFADLEKAIPLIVNAKTQRPGVCNACEKLLIHRKIAEDFTPVICRALHKAKVEIRGDEFVRKNFDQAKPATEEDWDTEYLDMIIGIKVVENFDDAVSHIGKYSTGHSDAILTENYNNANAFTELVDSAAVYVNASTRFTDGEEFGLGAEVGISTQKLHARGPMGLTALTSTKFIIFGNGQIRA